VTLTSCPAATPGSIPSNERWTIYRNTGTYETSYRIIDNSNHCLEPIIPPSGTTSFLITASCDDSMKQKWNAPPWINSAPLKDLGEK
jgi:hypothetical protein